MAKTLLLMQVGFIAGAFTEYMGPSESRAEFFGAVLFHTVVICAVIAACEYFLPSA